jgi:predicted RNase H-like HicB family nuclease
VSRVDYIARVHQEDGSMWAEVLDLPGCFASGGSLDELREALEEAIALYLDDSDGSVPSAVRSTGGALNVDEMRVSVTA